MPSTGPITLPHDLTPHEAEPRRPITQRAKAPTLMGLLAVLAGGGGGAGLVWVAPAWMQSKSATHHAHEATDTRIEAIQEQIRELVQIGNATRESTIRAEEQIKALEGRLRSWMRDQRTR